MNSEYLPYLVFGAFALVLVALVWAVNRSRTQLAEEQRRTDCLQQDLKREEQRSRTLKDTVDRLTTLKSKQSLWDSASAPRRRMSSSVTESPAQSSSHHSTPVSTSPVDNTLANAMLFSHMTSFPLSPASAPSYGFDSGSGSDSGSCSDSSSRENFD